MNPEPFLPDGWTGDDISITCPHGHRREWDGTFDNTDCECSNPLKERGMI